MSEWLSRESRPEPLGRQRRGSHSWGRWDAVGLRVAERIEAAGWQRSGSVDHGGSRYGLCHLWRIGW